MRVCDVVLNSIWYDPRVRKQIPEYSENGLDVVAVGLKCERFDADKVALIPCKVTIVENDSLHVHGRRGLWSKLRREYLKFKKIRDAIVSYRPDVIHANDLNALIPAFAAKKKLGCRLIYDSHEVFVENYTNKRSSIATVLKRIEKHIAKRVDLMICVSHAAASYFAKEYGIQTPIVVTNCALKREIVCGKDAKGKSGFEVLNHGQFYEGRGYEIMAQAGPLLRDYPEIRLAVRGFGKLEQYLRETVKNTGVESFVFYPPVTVQELIPKAAEACVGVAITEPICLNFKLSISNKLFEYIAAGLPVIMSDIPEHRYLNDKYQFGIVLSENTPIALAKAIIELYSNKAFYNLCAANSQKLANEINWENEFKKIVFHIKNWTTK